MSLGDVAAVAAQPLPVALLLLTVFLLVAGLGVLQRQLFALSAQLADVRREVAVLAERVELLLDGRLRLQRGGADD